MRAYNTAGAKRYIPHYLSLEFLRHGRICQTIGIVAIGSRINRAAAGKTRKITETYLSTCAADDTESRDMHMGADFNLAFEDAEIVNAYMIADGSVNSIEPAEIAYLVMISDFGKAEIKKLLC